MPSDDGGPTTQPHVFGSLCVLSRRCPRCEPRIAVTGPRTVTRRHLGDRRRGDSSAGSNPAPSAQGSVNSVHLPAFRARSDAIDAVAIAHAALREGLDSLPIARLAGRELDVRLLFDHGERIVAQRTALSNGLALAPARPLVRERDPHRAR